MSRRTSIVGFRAGRRNRSEGSALAAALLIVETRRSPLAVPAGFALAPCELLSFPIGGRLVRLTWSDVARHAAPAGPVAGVVVLSSVYATAMPSIPYGDRWPRVFSWRPSAFILREGEALELTAYKHGTVRVFPFTGRREVVLTLGGPDDGLPGDPLEGMPLPEKLVKYHRNWLG